LGYSLSLVRTWMSYWKRCSHGSSISHCSHWLVTIIGTERCWPFFFKIRYCGWQF
jgi:hypothetical protein